MPKSCASPLRERGRGWLLSAGLAVALLFAGTAVSLAENPHHEEVFAPTTAILLPNSESVTSFDIGFDDPVIQKYFLADRTNATVDVVNTTNNGVTQLPGTVAFQGAQGGNNDIAGPNGVITVNHREVWAGDGDSTVKVIDLSSGVTTHTIPTNGTKRADELCVDPRDHLVLVANDADNPPFVSFISTDTYSVLGTITMNGVQGPKATNGIEQCQWSRRTGLFYLALPEVNGPGDDSQPGAVVVISPQSMSVVRTFTIPISSCSGPQGLAIGPENQILLGCNDPSKSVPSTVVINSRSGTVIHVLRNEDGADEVWYNDGDDHYFLARSAGATGQQLGVADAQTGKVDPSVTTGIESTPTVKRGGNHSVAADPVRNQVYVPIASTSGSNSCTEAGAASDAKGCIAVFTTSHDDRGKKGNHGKK